MKEKIKPTNYKCCRSWQNCNTIKKKKKKANDNILEMIKTLNEGL